MKIVCDACQAKYSISDDKVQGKVFKIRCKKCSNIIVVRGGANAAEPAPAPQEKDTRVYDYGYEGGAAGGGGEPAGDDAVWHLVINQDQVGPLTVAEVEQRFAAGEVDGETFTWREGFADWLPLSQVDVFANLAASGSTTSASSGADAVSAMFGSGGGDELGTTRSDPNDLFAAASSSRGRDDDDGADLFGSKPAAASADAAEQAAAQKLRGERNENSVLFSLNNLAQLASDTPRPAASSSTSSSSSSGHATGAAGGEGSGLIDIRSMASAYLGGSGAAPSGKPAASAGIGSIDDLPVFGGGGFSEPAVIMPVAARSAANNKMLYMMIAAVGLLAVVAIVMVVMLLKGDDKPQQVAGLAPTDTKSDKGTDSAGVADKDKDQDADKDANREPDKTASTETPGDTASDTPKEPDKTADKPKTTTTKTTTKTEPRSGGTTVAAKTEPKPKAEPKDSGGGCDEVSCVLSNYEGSCCAKYKRSSGGGGGGTAKPKSDLPDSLDRAMISAGIANVKARVTTCGDKSPAKGKVKVKVQVAGGGNVSNVAVETTPDPALGACVAAAVQKATFAKTQSGGSFSYPFVF
jgi:predicted Zn finger-like uncharacterized protein